MPTTNPQEQDTPPRPTQAANRHDFGRALRALRTWSGLTQKALEDGHPDLTDSTISDHERGVRLPRLEWLHSYVEHCLRHRNPRASAEYLNAEFHHWRTAWTRLERLDTVQAPAIPTQHTPTLAAKNDEHGRRVRLPRRGVWLIGGGGVVVVIVAAVVYATATGMFDTATPATPDSPAQLAGSTAPAVPVHASGHIENLRGPEGVDLDTNRRGDQNDPGIDISPAATSTHLYAMANKVTFTVLPEAGAEERQRCATAVNWMRQIPNIYDLTEGRQICVITDEGRYSLLTITKRASAATGTIDFHYTTWP